MIKIHDAWPRFVAKFLMLWVIGMIGVAACGQRLDPLVLSSNPGEMDRPIPEAVREPIQGMIREPIRGMTITCFRSGPGEWDSPQMFRTLVQVRQLGVTWISIHPYAWVGNQGRLWFSEKLDQRSVIQPLRQAHGLGLNVMLKPHLGYWGSRFRWRGEITFETESQWRRFFSDYERFIVVQAKMAQACHARLFCVGLEYIKTLHREKDWRRVIASVRKVYHGGLTYGANWSHYRTVPFWDALDYIGIQGYFPLSDQPDPSEAELNQGWDRVLREIDMFSRKERKPVLLTELGYSLSEEAARQPWVSRTDDTLLAERVKLRCIRVALARLSREKKLAGLFLWKWFPSDRSIRSDFTLQYRAMRQVISHAWSAHKKRPVKNSR